MQRKKNSEANILSWCGSKLWLLIVAVCLAWPGAQALAKDEPPALARARFRNGMETLRAFSAISQETRWSVVKLNIDRETVALGTVLDTNGLVLTKASELKPGKLTVWTAAEREADAEVLSTDEEEDLALVRVHAEGLRAIVWANEPVAVGQWAITPGIGDTPHAVGIVSALPHRVRPQRAFIGVQFDFGTSLPRIESLLPGLGAEKAGLKPGDVIVAINGAAVTNREQVVERVRELRAGQTLKLEVQREARQFEAEVPLMLPNGREGSSGSNRQRRLERLAGKVSQRAAGFEQAIEHDTVLQPWLCGGPLVNLQGKAIGVNIARAGRATSYALTPEVITRVFERLKTDAKSG